VRLFSWFILRRLRQDRLRSALTVAGIALGIGVVVGIRLANTSSVQGFSAALDGLAGAASLEIVAPGGVDETRLAGLAWLSDYGDVAPVVEADATLRAADGGAETLKVLGVDILRDRAIRAYQVTTAGGSSSEAAPLDLLSLLTAPDSVILAGAVARRYGLEPGARMVLVTGDTPRTFIVRGVLTSQESDRAVTGSVAIVDIATAQWAFGRLGYIDRLDVRLRPDLDVAGTERAIASRLPPGLSVQRPSRRGEQVEQMLRAFHFNLAALSYVALLVGLFMIYNTIATSVLARREEIGMLRALGTSQRVIAGLFLGEAAALGVAGTLLGLAAGTFLARIAVMLTGSTVSALYVAGVPLPPALGWVDVALASGTGLALSLVAAAAPAIEAARVSPLAALRGADRIPAAARVSRAGAAAGAGLLLTAAALTLPGAVNGLPLFGFVAALCIVFGAALLVPATLAGSVRASSRLLRRWGVEGLLAQANIAAGLHRLAVSVAALTVSVSMLVAIAVMIGSFRETVIYWIGQTLHADLYIAAGGRAGVDAPPTVSSDVESIVRAHPAVAGVESIRTMPIIHAGRPAVLGAANLSMVRDRRALLFKAPRGGPDLRGAAGGISVVVSEPFASRHRVAAGDRLRLDTPLGPRTFQVAGIYYDYATDRGVVLMDWATFRRHFGDRRPTGLSIYLRPGASADDVREELAAGIGGRHLAFVHTSATLREQALRIFDRTFAVTYALEAIAIIVGMLGVAVTLLTLIVERRRDLTILRLLGTARRQIRRVVLLEAGFIGVVSQALGLCAGLALAVLLVYVINVQSFGWTIQFDIPVLFLVQSSILLLLAALAAGLYPARVAGSGDSSLRDDE
jgi:putative ABC transport system permease protein